MKVVKVNVTAKGDIDMDHLRKMCEKHKDTLAAIMVTYPSTYGVFDESITDICDVVHSFGGQVWWRGRRGGGGGGGGGGGRRREKGRVSVSLSTSTIVALPRSRSVTA